MIQTFRSTSVPLLCLAAALVIPTEAGAARPTAHLRDHGGFDLVDGRTAPRRGDIVYQVHAPDLPALPAARQARAMSHLRAQLGTTWAAWDDTTGVPRRLLTSGTAAPATVADPWEAARIAKALLAEHVDALAPGAAASDFVLVSNHLSSASAIRTVGFTQLHRGREVLGGQVSFRFAHDRLVAIGSEALPFVDAAVPSRRINEADAQTRAQDWIEASVAGTVGTVAAPVGPSVFPLLHPDEDRPQYREVFAVDVRVTGPDSAWRVYLDSETGDPIAREQTLSFASGTVTYSVPQRSPSFGPRLPYLARDTELFVDGAPQLTNAAGQVTFMQATAQVGTGLTGPLRDIVNASGEIATASLFVGDGGSTDWNAGGNELVDAQVAAFIHTDLVKEYVRNIDPSLEWLNEQIRVTVNIEDECNAFSDGDSINFFIASEACENTGLISDVVYHEFGHSVHRQSLIPGVGAFDGSLSEGVSDYLSATITGDPNLARGFFFSEVPLRNLDTGRDEAHWPDDAGEVHDAGVIIGSALWDLRKAMIAKHGEVAGVQITDHIYYEATRRAVDMPSMHAEALIVDDDDGDVSNGTPNGCEINAAFGMHGLFSVGDNAENVTLTETDQGLQVDLQLALPSFPGCPVTAIGTLEYRPRGATDSTDVPMSPSNGGYTAAIADALVGEVLQYRVRIEYSVGATHLLPDNRADPWYEIFVGDVQPLFCTTFNDDATNGWQLDGFEIAAPAGTGSPVDPPSGYDADGIVLGHSLGGDGFYFAGTSDSATSTPITFNPAGYASVRLQYQRWLSVEDGVFDQATLDIDGETAWSNYTSPDEDQATTHHTDREWRFHDIDISEQAADGVIELGFTLHSDGGLELGGWAVDALCIVGVGEQALPTCGNGLVEDGETCDDGNVADGDGCSAVCVVEPDDQGDGGDDGDDDDGPSSGDDGDSVGDTADQLVPRGCVCTAEPEAPAPRLGWLLVLGLLGLRRRRQPAS